MAGHLTRIVSVAALLASIGAFSPAEARSERTLALDGTSYRFQMGADLVLGASHVSLHGSTYRVPYFLDVGVSVERGKIDTLAHAFFRHTSPQHQAFRTFLASQLDRRLSDDGSLDSIQLPGESILPPHVAVALGNPNFRVNCWDTTLAFFDPEAPEFANRPSSEFAATLSQRFPNVLDPATETGQYGDVIHFFDRRERNVPIHTGVYIAGGLVFQKAAHGRFTVPAFEPLAEIWEYHRGLLGNENAALEVLRGPVPTFGGRPELNHTAEADKSRKFIAHELMLLDHLFGVHNRHQNGAALLQARGALVRVDYSRHPRDSAAAAPECSTRMHVFFADSPIRLLLRTGPTGYECVEYVEPRPGAAEVQRTMTAEAATVLAALRQLRTSQLNDRKFDVIRNAFGMVPDTRQTIQSREQGFVHALPARSVRGATSSSRRQVGGLTSGAGPR